MNEVCPCPPVLALGLMSQYSQQSRGSPAGVASTLVYFLKPYALATDSVTQVCSDEDALCSSSPAPAAKVYVTGPSMTSTHTF